MTKKADWQRNKRKLFRELNGYSQSSHYATGGLRAKVLLRDEYKCVKCSMSDKEHKAIWQRPITIDHINKDRRNNTLGNLQTLCLKCHGRKDILPRLKIRRVEKYKKEIIIRRLNGETYQTIADSLGFSIASIWKWLNIWNYGKIKKYKAS